MGLVAIAAMILLVVDRQLTLWQSRRKCDHASGDTADAIGITLEPLDEDDDWGDEPGAIIGFQKGKQ